MSSPRTGFFLTGSEDWWVFVTIQSTCLPPPFLLSNGQNLEQVVPRIFSHTLFGKIQQKWRDDLTKRLLLGP